MVLLLKKTTDQMKNSHYNHVNDLAVSTDINVREAVKDIYQELDFVSRRSEPDLFIYQQTGEEEGLRSRMEDFIAAYGDNKIGICLMKEDQLLLSIGREGTVRVEFPYGIRFTVPFLCCQEEGEDCLAFASTPTEAGFYYVSMVEPFAFYRSISDISLAEDYWMVLYDRDNGFVYNSDILQKGIEKLTEEEILARNDGLSIVLQSEKEGNILRDSYSYEYNGLHSWDMVSIPSKLSANGHFTVAIANCNDDNRNAMFQSTGVGLFCIFLLLSGSVLLTFYLYNSNKKETMYQKQLQELNELAHHQRLEMIGTMTASISHDFNNLLTPILANSVMALNNASDEDEELIDDLSAIYSAASRAKKLVARISSLSKKNREDQFSEFTPDELVRGVQGMLSTILPPKIELHADLQCEDVVFRADRAQLEQTIMNLVRNSFQALEGNGGHVTITTAKENGNAVIQVIDDGPGIPKEILPKIFDPFFSTKGVDKGTGLGLSIARHVAEEYGGSIRAESEEGKGATVILTFPISKNSGGGT